MLKVYFQFDLTVLCFFQEGVKNMRWNIFGYTFRQATAYIPVAPTIAIFVGSPLWLVNIYQGDEGRLRL
jgi:hypothetical protein